MSWLTRETVKSIRQITAMSRGPEEAILGIQHCYSKRPLQGI